VGTEPVVEGATAPLSSFGIGSGGVAAGGVVLAAEGDFAATGRQPVSRRQLVAHAFQLVSSSGLPIDSVPFLYRYAGCVVLHWAKHAPY